MGASPLVGGAGGAGASGSEVFPGWGALVGRGLRAFDVGVARLVFVVLLGGGGPAVECYYFYFGAEPR